MSDAIAFKFSTAGCRTLADDTLRLTIDVEPRDAAEAFRYFGQRGVHGAIALLADNQELTPEVPSWSAELHRRNFFCADTVLRALGLESEYKSWIEAQPCANCGKQDYDGPDGRCTYAHVRRAGQAGTGYKPPYRAIPLCDTCHHKQHQHGESALEVDFDKALGGYLNRWGHDRLREALGGKLKEIPFDTFLAWAEKNELEDVLPSTLRAASNSAGEQRANSLAMIWAEESSEVKF
jgi:hypothetical protein